MSLYFLSWEARLAAIRASRKSVMSWAGALGAGAPGEGGFITKCTVCKLESASGYNTSCLVHPEHGGKESYAGTADPNQPSARRPTTGAGEGQASQLNVISARSSLVMPSPHRADLQLSFTYLFLDIDTNRPARNMLHLKA